MTRFSAGRFRAGRARRAGGPYALFETLEPRRLLAVPYGFTSFADLFDLAGDSPTGVIGASPSLDFVFTDLNARLALIDGVETPFASIPGVGPDGAVVGVNEAGLIVGAIIIEGTGLGQDAYGDLFIVESGVRTMLSDAITTVVGGGGAAPDAFTFVEVGEDGSILLDGGGDAWLLEGGTLTFLFDGRPIDMNARGDVVGALAGGAAPVPVFRTADGALTELTSLLSATAINDDGTIGGTIATDTQVNGASVNTPVLLRDGRIVPLQPSRLPDGFFPGEADWRFFGLSDQEHAVVRLEVTDGAVEVSEYYILAADGTLAPAMDVTFGAGAESPGIAVNPFAGTGGAVALGGGRFLTPSGFIHPLDAPLPWTAADGSTVHPAAQGGPPVIAAQGELGDVLVIRNVGGEWLGSKMQLGEQETPLDEVLTYVDPKDGRTYVFALVDGGVRWGRLRHDRAATLGALTASPPPTEIVDHATVFISADGRVHLAGTDANGDLIIFYQNNSATPSAPANWSYNNLTEEHLEVQGLPFAPVASNLTAYIAPWGASHIAYLDDAGSVQVVWWAPGQTLWTTTNLSDAAEATPLQGSLTSYVTSWGGLNVAGTDTDGNLVALWWVPGFGGDWAFDRLADDDAAKLDPAGITSWVTPWGAMNIAGIDRDTGDVTAYWWTPATNVWSVEAIDLLERPAELAPAGRLTSAFTGGDTQNIFARDETSGHIIRLFWTLGDGGEWTFESISTATALGV